MHSPHIEILNQQKKYKIDVMSVENLVLTFFQTYQIQVDHVLIVFTSVPKIKALHDKYFQDPTITDCISLPTLPIEIRRQLKHFGPLGEIFVCPEVAKRYSLKHNLDFYQELSLYVVHGLLHLLGYDDYEEEDKKKMRKEELKILKILQLKNRFIHSSIHEN